MTRPRISTPDLTPAQLTAVDRLCLAHDVGPSHLLLLALASLCPRFPLSQTRQQWTALARSEGWSGTRLAREAGVSVATGCRWLREA